jgi:hypothetical protein
LVDPEIAIEVLPLVGERIEILVEGVSNKLFFLFCIYYWRNLIILKL